MFLIKICVDDFVFDFSIPFRQIVVCEHASILTTHYVW